MSRYADLRATGFAFGANLTPPADLVGGFLAGPLHGRREVVLAEPNYVAFHEADDRLTLDIETYGTVYQYPRGDYTEHVRRHGSPKGYAGPAACCRLVWDVDRADDLPAALADARRLARFLAGRYGDDGLGAYWSGGKGLHVSLLCPPGFHPFPHVPAVVKLLCLAVARQAGVRVDPTIYDTQRLFRLPNTRHARSGLYKRFLDPAELHQLPVERVREIARHPAGFAVPGVTEPNPTLEADWLACERRVLDGAAGVGPGGRPDAPSSRPVVPEFVRAFLAFGEIAGAGRAVTLFRCAAALSEAGTPPAVVVGLLEEPARKCGLDPAEVARQLAAGIAHGRRGQDGGAADWRPGLVARAAEQAPGLVAGVTYHPPLTAGGEP